MFKKKLIIRVDDVHPSMNIDNFYYFINLMERENYVALLGVIPDCKDESLLVDKYRYDFFDKIKKLVSFGWSVCQHGYNHVYSELNVKTNLRGYDSSEFAGLDVLSQQKKLTNGLKILNAYGIHTKIFMAPGHTFDNNTLKALKLSGFNTITDGFGIFPYKKHGIVHVPQLISKAHGFAFGIYTTCIHLDNMSFNEIKLLVDSFKNYEIVSIEDVNYNSILSITNTLFNFPSRVFLKYYRFLKSFKN